MTAPIVERLLSFEDRDVPNGTGDGGTVKLRVFRNPDGKEAADTITDLLAALNAVKGYMLNARIDLETGTKAAGIVTIQGGIKRIDAAIAKAKAS